MDSTTSMSSTEDSAGPGHAEDGTGADTGEPIRKLVGDLADSDTLITALELVTASPPVPWQPR
jgi:hypothetical protein